MCPRFHVDNVQVRGLLTWCGPGTEYVEDRLVNRQLLRNLPKGDLEGYSAITGGKQSVKRASAGDFVWLKGNRWPHGRTRGAIHRSPGDVDSENPRLLLKLDPAHDLLY